MTILATCWEDQQETVKSRDKVLASIGFNTVSLCDFYIMM